MSTAPTVAVSSWPLHHLLGSPPVTGPGDELAPYPPGELSLLEVPAALAAHGYNTMEICHFHLPSLDDGYLAELRGALEAANVKLLSLLVDGGDITHPEFGGRDLEWITSWLRVASALGAERMRVIAGKTKGEGAVELAARTLNDLAAKASEHGIRITTENWFDVTDSPEAVRQILDAADIGFNIDFGNWQAPEKFDMLEKIASRAETAHAKADFDAQGDLDTASYARHLEIMALHYFTGPFTLVATASATDPWPGLDVTRRFINRFLA